MLTVKTIEVRQELKVEPVVETVELEVATGKYRQTADGEFEPITVKQTVDKIVDYTQSPITVVGVVFESSRETYYENEYALLVEDVGQDTAIKAAALAGWSV